MPRLEDSSLFPASAPGTGLTDCTNGLAKGPDFSRGVEAEQELWP
jgi:hypothetical protein